MKEFENIDADRIDWDKGDGLVPAIVQDAATSRVRMLGYMNREALAQTMETGKVTFFGRSKQKLWVKGETSGNFLHVESIKIDCDSDTLLIQARPDGPTCHLGTETCFGEGHDPDIGFLGQLEQIVAARSKADPEKSYVAKLMGKGIEKIAQKVGEEAVETALAAAVSPQRLAEEAADLLFHLVILLKARDLALSDVADVLEKRHQEAGK